MCVCESEWICLRLRVYAYVYVCAFVCVCVCVCVHPGMEQTHGFCPGVNLSVGVRRCLVVYLQYISGDGWVMEEPKPSSSLHYITSDKSPGYLLFGCQ